MTDIYLVDYLGVHCGMHYYLEAFKQVLAELPDVNVRILSNFAETDREKPFFINQYKGNKINKGTALLRNLWRLRKFVGSHRNDVFIYLTYGNSIDLPFMRIISKAPRHVIDIHEAIAQNVDSSKNLRAKFKNLYSSRIKSVISHSTRTDDFLREYGYSGRRFTVPHFRYVFPKDYDISALSDDIRNAPRQGKVNLLFFGNLNESKGVDILIDAINRLEDKAAEKLNVIIAGKDFDGAVDRVKPLESRLVSIFRRHISDDELRYLYGNVDYLALPYRKTSQSGILEMAFYFKRPIIASDVVYFRRTLEEFPSFGIIAGNTAEEYADALSKTIENHNNSSYYTDSDYDRYLNRAEVGAFVNDFARWMKS